MTSIQPELWVEGASAAVDFYQAAFGAVVLHRVGSGDDIVAQLAVGGATFWVTEANAEMQRFSPLAIGGTTSRTLLVVDHPDAVIDQVRRAGATEIAAVGKEHGWRIGRVVDPFGHEWEIGKPLGVWPPDPSPGIPSESLQIDRPPTLEL
jgi:PhnB protein